MHKSITQCCKADASVIHLNSLYSVFCSVVGGVEVWPHSSWFSAHTEETGVVKSDEVRALTPNNLYIHYTDSVFIQ